MTLRFLYVVHDDLSVQSAASVNTVGRIRALVKLGCEVRLVCGGAPQNLPDGVTVDVISRGWFKPFSGMNQRMRLYRRLGWSAGLFKPDIMMMRGMYPLPAEAAHNLKLPMVAEVHGCLLDELMAVGTKPWRVKLAMHWERRAVAKVSGVIALDRTIERRMVELWPTLGDKITFIPNGVDVARFPPVEASVRLKLRAGHRFSPEDRVMGFAGMLWDIYDFRGVFGAMASDPRLRLIVAGDGELMPVMERQAQDLGVADRCRFLGKVSAAVVNEVYAASDIGVMPNIPALAGLHLKVFEYAAAGLPLLAPRCEDLAFLEGEGLALLSEGLETDAVTKAIAGMSASGMLTDVARDRRRAYAAQHFSWDHRMAEVLEFCERIQRGYLGKRAKT